jgi:hypothetical protein
LVLKVPSIVGAMDGRDTGWRDGCDDG